MKKLMVLLMILGLQISASAQVDVGHPVKIITSMEDVLKNPVEKVLNGLFTEVAQGTLPQSKTNLALDLSQKIDEAIKAEIQAGKLSLSQDSEESIAMIRSLKNKILDVLASLDSTYKYASNLPTIIKSGQLWKGGEAGSSLLGKNQSSIRAGRVADELEDLFYRSSERNSMLKNAIKICRSLSNNTFDVLVRSGDRAMGDYILNLLKRIL